MNATAQDQPTPANQGYDTRFGEKDLIETETQWHAGLYIFGVVVTLLTVSCFAATLVGMGFVSVEGLMGNMPTPSPTQAQRPATGPEGATATQTPRPTRQLITVTPAPPTATPTPTEGPCRVQVTANDTLIGIISSCGHRDLDVLDEVLEINDLQNASAISLGQEIEVPRPTPTVDPNLALTEEAQQDGEESEGATANESFSQVIFADGADGLPTFTPTPPPTLPAGIQWHTVQPEETIIHIVTRYGAGVEVLSQLNPEVTFSQCEFNAEMPYGGPSCNVMLFQGMRLRVPAPTPTPTLSPTPSGSETATPTPTPTFNAPSLISPGNRVLFQRGELVTLRWRGTGTLGPQETYRVQVENTTTGVEYQMDVRDTSLILPREWQERDGQRYDYTWHVSVINTENPDAPLFNTETRIFTWEALESEEE